jgi:hypothetical protein
MIVLAASSLIGMIGLIALSGRLDSTNLQITSNNFTIIMNQTITDNLSSFLNGYSKLYCMGSNSGQPATLSSTPFSDLIANPGCIFLGTVVQFDPNSKPGEYVKYPVVGNQVFTQVSGPEPVQSLLEAYPEPVDNSATVDLSQTLNIGDNITVSSLKANGNNVGAIAFILSNLSHSLSSYDINNNLSSGNAVENLYYVDNISLGDPVATDLQGHLMAASSAQICLDEGGQKSVLVTISGSQNLNVTTTNKAGDTC